MQKLCIGIFCIYAFCFLPQHSYAGDNMIPTRIHMQDVFFDWLRDCYNGDTLHLGGEFVHPNKMNAYINTIQKNFTKITQNIIVQKKHIVVDLMPVPYVYIDEDYKFVNFIRDYSNKNVINLYMQDYNYSNIDDVKYVLRSINLYLLPFRSVKQKEYILVVIGKRMECGNESGDIWFFKVLAEEYNKKLKFTFTSIESEDDYIPRYNNKILEDYDMLDFEPTKIVNKPEDRRISWPLYDIDKHSADLFIYDDADITKALRFEWNGERYVKKGLVARDLNQAREKKRGQE